MKKHLTIQIIILIIAIIIAAALAGCGGTAEMQYYPQDYYSGTFVRSTGELSVSRKSAADSSVQINIKGFVINSRDTSDQANTVTLELVSKADQTVSVRLESYQSDDNMARGDAQDVELKAGEPKTITMSFSGWENYKYWADITADNTRVSIAIVP